MKEATLDLKAELISFEEIIADLLDTDQSVHFQAKGSSMLPFIQNGANLRVSPLKTTPPAIGEVVLCLMNNPISPQERILVHRLIARDGAGRFITRGDHCPEPDSPHEPANVLGRVTMIEQPGGRRYLLSRSWRWLNWAIATSSKGQIYFNYRFQQARSAQAPFFQQMVLLFGRKTLTTVYLSLLGLAKLKFLIS